MAEQITDNCYMFDQWDPSAQRKAIAHKTGLGKNVHIHNHKHGEQCDLKFCRVISPASAG